MEHAENLAEAAFQAKYVADEARRTAEEAEQKAKAAKNEADIAVNRATETAKKAEAEKKGNIDAMPTVIRSYKEGLAEQEWKKADEEWKDAFLKLETSKALAQEATAEWTKAAKATEETIRAATQWTNYLNSDNLGDATGLIVMKSIAQIQFEKAESEKTDVAGKLKEMTEFTDELEETKKTIDSQKELVTKKMDEIREQELAESLINDTNKADLKEKIGKMVDILKNQKRMNQLWAILSHSDVVSDALINEKKTRGLLGQVSDVVKRASNIKGFMETLKVLLDKNNARGNIIGSLEALLENGDAMIEKMIRFNDADKAEIKTYVSGIFEEADKYRTTINSSQKLKAMFESAFGPELLAIFSEAVALMPIPQDELVKTVNERIVSANEAKTKAAQDVNTKKAAKDVATRERDEANNAVTIQKNKMTKLSAELDKMTYELDVLLLAVKFNEDDNERRNALKNAETKFSRHTSAWRNIGTMFSSQDVKQQKNDKTSELAKELAKIAAAEKLLKELLKELEMNGGGFFNRKITVEKAQVRADNDKIVQEKKAKISERLNEKIDKLLNGAGAAAAKRIAAAAAVNADAKKIARAANDVAETERAAKRAAKRAAAAADVTAAAVTAGGSTVAGGDPTTDGDAAVTAADAAAGAAPGAAPGAATATATTPGADTTDAAATKPKNLKELEKDLSTENQELLKLKNGLEDKEDKLVKATAELMNAEDALKHASEKLNNANAALAALKAVKSIKGGKRRQKKTGKRVRKEKNLTQRHKRSPQKHVKWSKPDTMVFIPSEPSLQMKKSFKNAFSRKKRQVLRSTFRNH